MPDTRSATPSFPLPSSSWRCGEFEIDVQARRITRSGAEQALGDRAFDLLLALIAGQGRLMSSDELRAAVWPRARVAENNLRVQLTHLRKLLGTEAIEYRPRQGYRLAWPVSSTAAPDPQATPHPVHVPEPATAVLGRAVLLAELADQLRSHDRVTLHGVGGAGKTVLAQVAAREAAPAFADGAWWVDLAPLSEASLVPMTLAEALQLPPGADPMARVTAHLADKQLLLVLDNCEHLVPAVTALCDSLLRAAPRVSVLATSRLPLKCAGERLVTVGALGLSSDQAQPGSVDAGGALAVFEARVRSIDPRFRLSAANLNAAIDICQRLDGLAFAITLAATHVPALGLGAVQARLDERLRWQSRPGDERPQHQSSLQQTLDWSHDLLTPVQQRVLRAMGVFAGSFTLEDLQHIVPPEALAEPLLLQALQGLIEHGLLALDTPSLLGKSAPHYGLHESVRLYARQRLDASDEASELRTAHARHFLGRMGGGNPAKRRTVSALAPRFELLNEMHAALAWASAHNLTLAMDLCASCCMAWRRLGWHELARRNAAPLLAQAVGDSDRLSRVDLLAGLCGMAYERDELDETVRLAQEALALLDGHDEPIRAAMAVSWLANVAAIRGELAEAELRYRQGLAESERAGDALGVRDETNNLGWVLQARGRFDEGRAVLQSALAMSVNDDWGRMVTHENLAELELSAGQREAAVYHLHCGIVLARRVPDAYRLCQALAMLGMACTEASLTTDAPRWLRECLEIAQSRRFERMQVWACIGLARCQLAAGRPIDAQALLHAAEGLRAGIGATSYTFELACEAEVQARVDAALDSSARTLARARGELMTIDEMLALAA